MLLFYSKTSPYSRKVRLVILEKNLSGAVTLINCNPFENVPGLYAANPLGKVPTLLNDESCPLYDSPVICDYLDSFGEGPRLIPESGPARWRVRRWEALADGLIDAAYDSVMETRRPQAEQSDRWLSHWWEEINRGLTAAEATIDTLEERLTLAHIALGAALGYLDFRLPTLDWRWEFASLRDWFEAFSVRESMRLTAPTQA